MPRPRHRRNISKRPRSFTPETAVYCPRDRGLLPWRPRSFTPETAVYCPRDRGLLPWRPRSFTPETAVFYSRDRGLFSFSCRSQTSVRVCERVSDRVGRFFRRRQRTAAHPLEVPCPGAKPAKPGRNVHCFGVTSRTDGILMPMRKDSRADEKKFSWARERSGRRHENVR